MPYQADINPFYMEFLAYVIASDIIGGYCIQMDGPLKINFKCEAAYGHTLPERENKCYLDEERSETLRIKGKRTGCQRKGLRSKTKNIIWPRERRENEP